jgi:NAD(P)-dependent dehydrogenase (short-subunit alcohol dehydrogenase family)
MTEPMLADERFHSEVIRRIPAGEIGEVDDVVGAVLYLASHSARLVTGHILAVDGGWVAW